MLSQVAGFSSFLWLNSIIHYSLFVCVGMHVYCIFFILLFFDRYLGYFHVLTMVNNAAVNTGMHMYFQISVFIFFG